MGTATLRILHEEHAALAVALNALVDLLARPRLEGADFATLHAVLVYLREFPGKCHHPKETELLFAALRARSPVARHLLDLLDREHAECEHDLAELERLLAAFETCDDLRTPFQVAARRFVDGYRSHIRMEERIVLPLARRTLTAEDWARLDEAFESNRDPLTGLGPVDDFRPLLDRIAGAVTRPREVGTVA